MEEENGNRPEDATTSPMVPPEKRLSLFRETSIPRKRLMRPNRQQNPVVAAIVDDIVDHAIASDDMPHGHSANLKRVCVPDEDLCISEGWCSVCNGGESTPGDLIVYCDMCGIPVHQSCYGVPIVPKGNWNCQRCTALLVTNQSPSSMICAICHRYGGAMKPLRRIQRVTTLPEWVHVLCVWWDHDIVVPNMHVMEPLQMVHPPMNNRQRTCMICHRNEGYLIQCHWNQCNAWFHAICARFGDANTIHCHRDEPQRHLGGGFLQVEIEDGHRAAFHGYCPRHATQEFCLDDVVTKLVASDLISDVKIARAIEKLPTSTPDPDEQLAALGKWLVKYAEQSMASMPSLQLLQILVDHLPQIYKTYPSTTIQLHDLLGGAWIEKLHATFGRHADDPFDYCAVCEEPLTHLDHGFYCTNSHRPHMQHWSCQTKPVVVAASRPSKKKVKSTRLSKPPTPSSLIAEGRAAAAAIARRPPTRDSWPEAVAMLCGVCSLPMDHRAVAVSKSGGFHVLPIVETTAVYANQVQCHIDHAWRRLLMTDSGKCRASL
ncbi:hypothetical protein, variant 1 [Aphanomyces invadans]|uniref:PHD-type domain-containing protein n=1 Tax=Aphanomyces invadans TaxID=157072 RepID=A0A024ULL2_9STRA|nr:hypothetical protein, variant 1 [Aphanomyces invadans]ETW07065.1 hypothetical protein, variant 1 [Aphanomyces invadans]|eukprot:XP_008865140.1 hypothetical protein, variant 1 [Aphanomyces invadans]